MIKKIGIGLLIIFVAIQFYRPVKNVASETSVNDFLQVHNVSTDLTKIIKTSCYDCHSNNTNYPWYAEVAPLSWWIAHHIDEAKEELNFSEWNTFSEKRKEKKLKEIIGEIEDRKMPLKTYLPVHPEAELSDEQIIEITTWVNSLRK